MKYILSITSYKPRFESLYQVLSEVPQWDVLPEKIILNLTPEDFDSLQFEPHKKFSKKFEINITTDMGPAKKLIPTLRVYQNAAIVTIDDDIHYSPNTITKVLVEHLLFPRCLISGRAHKILYDDEGNMLPYMDWHGETTTVNGPTYDLFPTGAGMVLYPPNSLHSDVFDLKTYSENCFFGDDFWFFFHARRMGTLIRRVPLSEPLNYVEGSQQIGLWHENRMRNDVYLQNLLSLYGNPLFM